MFIVKVAGKFEAAHLLENYNGKCSRLHGHNWRVEAEFAGTKLDDVGILVDFKIAKNCLNSVLDEFDHRYLNELEPFNRGANPTAENLAKFVFEKLAAVNTTNGRAVLVAVTVWEGDDSSVTYKPDGVAI